MSTSSNGTSGAAVPSTSKPNRRRSGAEPRTVRDFLINQIRLIPLLTRPVEQDEPIGQGWWIQAEFGSVSRTCYRPLEPWPWATNHRDIVQQLEIKNKKGKRESIYQFYDDGLAKKSSGNP